ncbi:putative leucine-rich repeat-containing protein DDB_G0290503 [Culicoides brevitarsis]|uniref:putative leucine-rich repeat-containing protein DDB_G0290503 n=1 Tax=Culicoides brevitarsis TaxID=469753 RepID=UPI00307CB211
MDNRFSFSRMSFGKGKLKKVSDIAGIASPVADSKKDKENSKSAKKLEKLQKEKLRFGSLDAESIKPAKSNFFRTPSLPRRLKFKSSADPVTPKKGSSSSSLESASETKTSTLTQLYNKIDQNKAALDKANKENTNLKQQISFLEETVTRLQDEKTEIGSTKDKRIAELEREMSNLNKADELLQSIAEKSLDKIREMEDEMRQMMKNHEQQLDGLTSSKNELETKLEEIIINYQANQDENTNLRFENQFLRQELNQYQSMMQLQSNELNAKIEEIKFLEKSMEEIMEESGALKEQIQLLKVKAEEDIKKCIEDASSNMRELETLRRERSNLIIDLQEKQELIKALHDELAERQVEIDGQQYDFQESYSFEIHMITEKYEERINKLQEMHEMKLKEVESVFVLEKAKIMKEHAEELEKLKEEQTSEIERANETAAEKIKIAEVQAEERIKALEASIESTVAREKALWQVEMDKCQKIAETEIIKCELEKRDLKSLLEATNQLLKERDEAIQDLQCQILSTSGPAHKVKEEYDMKLKNALKEAAKLKTEKYNYQLTLSNTRSTVNILMERLKKADSDVEILKQELDQQAASKIELEAANLKLQDDVEEYKKALAALTNSSRALEQQLRQKEQVYEQLMASEEEAVTAVTQIGQLFSSRIDENMSKYLEMYDEMKKKYEARESYIRDMKLLMEEFATGIELARIELDTKEKKLFELEQENKDIKLENMTYKFKCEQFEKYQSKSSSDATDFTKDTQTNTISCDDENLVSNKIIENIINQLDKDAEQTIPNKDGEAENQTNTNDEKLEILNEIITNESNKIIEENQLLKEKLRTCEDRLKILEEFANDTSSKYKELLEQQNNKTKLKDTNLKEINVHLKNKIAKLQEMNKKQESTIMGLQEQIEQSFNSPHKLNISAKFGSPRTPKSLMSVFAGKENQSPIPGGMVSSPKSNVLKPRNN